eukprot:TRINITY_DN5015_c0_g1_i1.p2 TRINITY_DN5015_c0_g1~~TRINITY_DN5015_c0_g1_i1.p2  ORF type:complete len:115 (+),score=21.78 TRINITY_DN5015_c0_g1_i1:851-1195(+)
MCQYIGWDNIVRLWCDKLFPGFSTTLFGNGDELVEFCSTGEIPTVTFLFLVCPTSVFVGTHLVDDNVPFQVSFDGTCLYVRVAWNDVCQPSFQNFFFFNEIFCSNLSVLVDANL